MRQGELLGLRWRDVDWAARRISVHHTLVRMHGRWWLGDPKTAKSERAVALTDPTIDLLRAHRAHQAERLLAIGHRVTDDDFVFCDDAGEPLWGRHVTTREFGPLLRQAELPPIRFHDLRHTFATLQLAAGTNPKVVSEVLGHKDVGHHPRPLQPRHADDAGRGHGPPRRDARPLAARATERGLECGA